MKRKLDWQHSLVLAGFGALSACEPQSIQTIDGLTLIAVEASPPSANPGDRVELELTYFDPLTLRDVGGADGGLEDDSEPLQIAWFGGCHNPPRESATGCLPQLGQAAATAVELLEEGDAQDVDPELLSQLGFGPRFVMQIPDEPVSDRQRRPDLVPFGVSYAFFGICRGEFTLLPEALELLPVDCVDRDGVEVDERDFLIGFTTIYVYDDIVNDSPEVSGIEFDGERIETATCTQDDDCSALGRSFEYACHEEQCIPRVKACAGDCESISVAPIVDRDVGELDATSVAIGQEPKRELVWVKYHAVGSLDRRESLIMDRDGELRERFAAKWTPPGRADIVVPVFAVVQDSRGGTTPTRVDVMME